MAQNIFQLQCENCKKSDWDVSKRVIRGISRVLCNSCAGKEKISNDGT